MAQLEDLTDNEWWHVFHEAMPGAEFPALHSRGSLYVKGSIALPLFVRKINEKLKEIEDGSEDPDE